MIGLISRERAQSSLNLQTLSAAEIALVDQLIQVCSRAVERHCGRDFALTPYDELHDGRPGSILQLVHYPVRSVERIAGFPAVVLHVSNADAEVERSRVLIDAEGLTLIRSSGAVLHPDRRLFADFPTLGELASSIDALGSGWSATLPSDRDADLPSQDLGCFVGSFDAYRRPAGLRMHLDDIGDYDVVADRGHVIRFGGWHGGYGAWRIVYSAGFSEVPDDVQEACAEWVAALFFQTKRDPGLAQERLVNSPPASVRALLRPYRQMRIG